MESNSGFPLARGNTYRIRVRAVNAQGAGLPSQSVEASRPPGAPGAPFGLTADLRAEGGLTLHFGPTPDNGSPITGWEYTTDDGAHWQPLTGVTGDMQLTAVITTESTDGSTVLRTGVPYRIRVHAINGIGTGPDSQTATVLLPTPGAPAAPTDVSTGPSDDGIRVDFTAPDPGDSAIIKYQYSSDGGASWADMTASGTGPLEADLTVESNSGFPFMHGNVYPIRVRAVNTQGPGLPSEPAEISLPPTEPGAPWDLHVQPGDGTISLDFGGPSDNGSPITGWEYTTDDGAHSRPLTGVTGDWRLTATISTQSTDGTTPLATGTSYRLRIHAINGVGTGPDSDTATVVLPNPGAPGAPGDLTASPAGDAFGVDFTAPDPGDSAITRYQYSTDDGNTWVDVTPTGTGPLHADLTVESNSGFPFNHGDQYRIRIRGVNAQGPGMPSDAVDAALPPSAPGAPFDLTAEPRADAIQLTWDKPADNGSPVTGFYYSTDDGVSWQPVPPISYNPDWTSTSTITRASTGDGTTPLTIGGTYRVRLRADNALGTGTPTDAIEVTLGSAPATEPGAPSDITPKAGDGQVAITFSAPPPNGSDITGYAYSTDDGATWQPLVGYTQTDKVTVHATVDRLDNGVTYQLRLRASNAVGAGPASAAVAVTPYTVPDAPSGLTATPGNAGATLAFPVPKTGGSEITGYDYSTDGGTTWAALPSPTGTGTLTASITTASGPGRPAFTAGTAYQVRVRARNVAGAGAPSPIAPLTLGPGAGAGVPRGLTAAARNRSALLTFQAPADTGGGAVTGYQVSIDNGGTWTAVSPAGDGGALKVTIGDLTNNTTYQIQVRAVTAAGPGSATVPVSVTPHGPPAPPTGVTATAQTATITVSWVPPAAGGAPVTGYTATASPGPATCDTTGATSCVLGAAADQAYTITVVAHSASGDSIASAPSGSVRAVAPPIPSTPPDTKETLGAGAGTGAGNAVQPGKKFTIRGSGYAPHSTVEIVVYSDPISLGTVVTDENGEFSVDVAVPPSFAGSHSIVAMGADPSGHVRSMRLDVTVAPRPASSLPVTGGSTARVALIGLFLLVLGGAAVQASRARRTR